MSFGAFFTITSICTSSPASAPEAGLKNCGFVATNPQFFKPASGAEAGDDVQIDVIVKNAPKLIVKIYEMNALNFFLTQHRQLNTDLNLDGLVANSEETHAF